VLGLLTPLAAAGVVGVMAVAWIANHFKNGFFIFNKGEGYEYVMTLLLCGVVLGTIGPGSWSLDDALEINDDLTGTTGLLLSLVAGGVGALLLLAVFWRPVKKTPGV
jgi:putative oxidoreductase